MNILLPIAQRFAQAQAIAEIKPLGNGLINDTFLVTTVSSSFVLQRINRQVFPVPEQIMENLLQLNRHIRQKSADTVKLQMPDILSAGENYFYLDETGDCWRALGFIADTESLEVIGKPSDAEQAGFALGHFHRLLSDFDPQRLHDTLPGFHITPGYLNHYHQVLAQSSRQIVSPESRYCADFIARNQPIADELETAKQRGLLSLRVIHGDPKLNNFLFDKNSQTIVSLIDLDTVKPGLVHYDVGDCLRSCCQASAPLGFDLAICAAILTSYLAEAGTFFTEYDYEYLYPAIRLIPFELGIRFFTDYLAGNRYFKVSDPEQNLLRALAQFQLCDNIQKQERALKQLIAQIKNAL